jgi:predicted nucleic acid-binding protein
MLVADTNVLIELFLPSAFCEVVLACRDADDDWRLPSLWLPEFRHVLLKFLRAGRLDLATALGHLAAAEQAFLPRTIAVDMLAQQMQCPLLTFDRKLLQLFPDVAVKPGS